MQNSSPLQNTKLLSSSNPHQLTHYLKCILTFHLTFYLAFPVASYFDIYWTAISLKVEKNSFFRQVGGSGRNKIVGPQVSPSNFASPTLGPHGFHSLSSRPSARIFFKNNEKKCQPRRSPNSTTCYMGGVAWSKKKGKRKRYHSAIYIYIYDW